MLKWHPVVLPLQHDADQLQCNAVWSVMPKHIPVGTVLLRCCMAMHKRVCFRVMDTVIAFL